MSKLYGYDGVYEKKKNGKYKKRIVVDNKEIVEKVKEFYNFLVDNNIPVGIFIDNKEIKINHNNKQVVIDITKKLKEKVLERKLKQVDLLSYYRFFQGFKELECFINKEILKDILEVINDF